MNRSVWWKLLVIFGLPASILFSLLNGLVSPIGWGIGVLFAALYLVAGLLLFRAGPLWPNAGAWYVLSCLTWGSGVSTALVLWPSMAWSDITTKLGWDPLLASFSGAIPEELAKALGVVLIVYGFRALNRPWHGFVTGGLIGLGFEINENLVYGAVGALYDANSDLTGAVSMWGLRSLAGPGIHVALAALSGWGIGLAIFCVGRRGALAWLGFSTFIHFVWNIITTFPLEQMIRLGVLMVILYGSFIYVYWKAVRMQKVDNSYVLLM
ncbi:PrsW family intramembrane metalloprotease [Corynebacterium epidermidicanis]|uniref:Putative membrane protein n=1 Tax=Corynebacterium epidermidicanis TaxID=1050174 RepID=A0A0G3GLH3_9CORY|nr:PrsW family intramembrane metalloprotease [Corynebacterium epidermidicanis]AKK02086.1 putative membrane protein [Corynebacterium epidermidicanis]